MLSGDRSYQPMDKGGHGELGFKIAKSAKSVIVPEVLGHQYKLPQGMFLIREHQAPSWNTAGACMPPCSGGRGNEYYVTVRAMVWDFANPKKSGQLAWAVLEMGAY